ncbi:Protein of unknown function [Clostridium cavendishii DSM 21758]|uniref:DUF2953 domain-containing protein n=1 Tax=Clostridium cavendishii DSM 21758 TaxID=1121302 RepID=A0A1M6F2Y6_9CLOT|nr:DUF2953 domain-containing protein [Clostridium cavendishii]SHI92033.1 Protein of unknown function [Clostridium cavendishii DSM 21758]
MSIFFIILLCFIFLVLVPFPLKLNITLENKELKIYFFKILLFSKERTKRKIAKKKKKTSKTKSYSSKITIDKLRSLYKTLTRNLFKSKLEIYFCMEYSLNDAAYTALSIAPAYDLAMLLINILDMPFKVKIKALTITPIFKDKFLLKLHFTSIIWTNLAKIIYVSILIFKKLREKN